MYVYSKIYIFSSKYKNELLFLNLIHVFYSQTLD